MALQAIYGGSDPSVTEDIDLYFSIFAQQLGGGVFTKGKAILNMEKLILFEKCKADRFGDQSELAGKVGITNYFMCPTTNEI